MTHRGKPLEENDKENMQSQLFNNVNDLSVIEQLDEIKFDRFVAPMPPPVNE